MGYDMSYSLPYTRAQLDLLRDPTPQGAGTGYFEISMQVVDLHTIRPVKDAVEAAPLLGGFNLSEVLRKLNRAVHDRTTYWCKAHETQYSHLQNELEQAIHPAHHTYYGGQLLEWDITHDSDLFKDWRVRIKLKPISIMTSIALIIHIRGRDLEAIEKAEYEKRDLHTDLLRGG